MFFNKKINLTRFKLSEQFHLETMIAKLRHFPAPKLDDVKDELLYGWARGDDPSSTEIDSSCMVTDRYLYVNMRTLCKKIHSGLFNFIFAKKQGEYKRLNNVSTISAKVKKELKIETSDFLLPRVTPTVSNTFAIFCHDGTVYLGSTSNTMKQVFYDLVYRSTGADLEKDSIEKKIPELLHKKFEGNAVFEYMTWFLDRAKDGVYTVPPYRFFSPEDSLCSKGSLDGMMAGDSPEFQTALKEGKLLTKVRVGVTGAGCAKVADQGVFSEDEVFYATLEKTGSLSGIMLPELETGAFVEKMDMVKNVFEFFDKTVEIFNKDAAADGYKSRITKK